MEGRGIKENVPTNLEFYYLKVTGVLYVLSVKRRVRVVT